VIIVSARTNRTRKLRRQK